MKDLPPRIGTCAAVRLNIIMADGGDQVVCESSGDKINYVVYGSDDKLKIPADGTMPRSLCRTVPHGYDSVKTALATSRRARKCRRISIPA